MKLLFIGESRMLTLVDLRGLGGGSSGARKIVYWCPPVVGAPTSGKSWIRHWLSYVSLTQQHRPHQRENRVVGFYFLGGLSLHLNHLIESRVANYDWPFGTLPFGLFGSNLDTRDLDIYPRTYSGHFWNMSIFDDSRVVWVLFRKWVVSENQSFLDEGAIVTPLSV